MFIFAKSTLTVIHHGPRLQITVSGGPGSSLLFLHTVQAEQKATASPIFLSAAKQRKKKKKSVQRSSTLCNFSTKWILFNLPAWDGPGPLDNVDGWCFNAAECYFYWTGKTINFYFIANDCALYAYRRGGWTLPMNNRLSQQMLLCRNQFLA